MQRPCPKRTNKTKPLNHVQIIRLFVGIGIISCYNSMRNRTRFTLNATTMPHPAPTTSWTSSSSSSSSSRWCPTPEQLMILEEMYRMGIHAPNASQIQQITAQLSSYGKIEGKNVFYWFQNHKARDRQRLRRKFIKQIHLAQHYRHNSHPFCFQLPSNPQQQLHYQILDHQRCFAQSVDEQSPSSHSPGFADSQHCNCHSPSCFLQGGSMGSKLLMMGASSPDDSLKGNKTVPMSIHGLLNRILKVDATQSCIQLQHLPQPLKTLDLFPTTATHLGGEERNPQHSSNPGM